MTRELVIELKDLPSRARQLEPDELRKVFGGCNGHRESCEKSSDCCSNECGVLQNISTGATRRACWGN